MIVTTKESQLESRILEAYRDLENARANHNTLKIALLEDSLNSLLDKYGNSNSK